MFFSMPYSFKNVHGLTKSGKAAIVIPPNQESSSQWNPNRTHRVMWRAHVVAYFPITFFGDISAFCE